MKILRASAGSGKTFRLSKHYIDLLMQSDDIHAYRHILAVTFTNKATAEMKARILNDLDKLSLKEPKARTILTALLHDYGAFSVSTIDRFFQQALKSFSRESGQFAAYQVELDKNALIQEAMDRILDGLTDEDKEITDWLTKSVMSKVEQGQKFKLEDGLYEIGKKLKNAEFRKISEGVKPDWSKDRLEALHKTCSQIVKSFTEFALAHGRKVSRDKWIEDIGPRIRKGDPELAQFFDDNHLAYSTAFILDKLVFSLGLAGEFNARYDELLKEKNVMPLDDSNDILKKMIDGSDAPFVYEKMGVRYDHFLLDEFQDTSNVQWENFLPLLKESDSRGGDNLVVGDVKQSIYRWRDSDWRLLGEQICRDFPDASVESMQNNWRSCRTIVQFNSEFFKFAAGKTNAADIYSDVGQTHKSEDPQDGCVRMSFTADQTGAVKESIAHALENGAKYGDIAILVRSHKDGGAVAEALIADGIPVISDDSLSLKSSVVVRRLVSLLSVLDNPGDSIGGFLARSLKVDIPDSHHSLVDLCENLLRQMRVADPDSFEGETPYVQAFLDIIQEWTETNGNNIRTFLKQWGDSNPVIGSPENSESVRIITIHKSKGLEFPYVIFPFANGVGGYQGNEHWCRIDTTGTGLGRDAGGIYPVKLEGPAKESLFKEDYDKEVHLNDIDNLNIFYVALTRAEKELHIIAKEPSNNCVKSLSSPKGDLQFGNMSELLYAWCGGRYEFGEAYDFTRLDRKASSARDFPAQFSSFGMKGRFRASEDAADFFGEDGVTGASARLCGIRMHAILAKVDSADDLPEDIDSDSHKLLKDRMGAHPEWFGQGCPERRDRLPLPDSIGPYELPAGGDSRDLRGSIGRNEVSIFDEFGNEHRPDRVIISPEGKVTVIDYKFGAEEAKYEKQVRRYMDLYRRMGYSDVSGFVWYVPEDRKVSVSGEFLLSL